MITDTIEKRDPLRNFKFRVVIPHPSPTWSGAKLATLGFMSASGLAATTEPLSYREGGDNTTPRKMPGQTDFTPIVLTRGLFPDDMLTWQWFREIWSFAQGNGVPGNDFRSNITIFVMEHPVTNPAAAGQHTAKVAFRLFNAWPASIAYSDLDAGGNGLMVNQMTLHHEGFDIRSASGVGNYRPASDY